MSWNYKARNNFMSGSSTMYSKSLITMAIIKKYLWSVRRSLDLRSFQGNPQHLTITIDSQVLCWEYVGNTLT